MFVNDYVILRIYFSSLQSFPLLVWSRHSLSSGSLLVQMSKKKKNKDLKSIKALVKKVRSITNYHSSKTGETQNTFKHISLEGVFPLKIDKKSSQKTMQSAPSLPCYKTSRLTAPCHFLILLLLQTRTSHINQSPFYSSLTHSASFSSCPRSLPTI